MKPEKKIVLKITTELLNKRLDVAVLALIQAKYPEVSLSRGKISRLIKAGRVTLNQAKTKAGHLIHLKDSVEMWEQDLVTLPQTLEPREINLPILYEDNFLLAIDKPAGIQVHPAGNAVRATVAHFIISRYPKIRGVGENPLRPGIVHRLDRETSGLLVVAKTQTAFEKLKKLFQDRKIEKTYLALVSGHTPFKQGVINQPLARHPKKLKRVVVRPTSARKTAREALTFYQVITRYRGFDLLQVTPKTGRTHQIRAHLAYLGNPIVGDKLYAFKPMRRAKKSFPERQMLHATGLRFELFGKKYSFEAPLPEDFRALLNATAREGRG